MIQLCDTLKISNITITGIPGEITVKHFPKTEQRLSLLSRIYKSTANNFSPAVNAKIILSR